MGSVDDWVILLSLVLGSHSLGLEDALGDVESIVAGHSRGEPGGRLHRMRHHSPGVEVDPSLGYWHWDQAMHVGVGHGGSRVVSAAGVQIQVLQVHSVSGILDGCLILRIFDWNLGFGVVQYNNLESLILKLRMCEGQ